MTCDPRLSARVRRALPRLAVLIAALVVSTFCDGVVQTAGGLTLAAVVLLSWSRWWRYVVTGDRDVAREAAVEPAVRPGQGLKRYPIPRTVVIVPAPNFLRR